MKLETHMGNKKPDFKNVDVVINDDEIYIKDGEKIYKVEAEADYDGCAEMAGWEIVSSGTFEYLYATYCFGLISEEEYEKKREEHNKDEEENRKLRNDLEERREYEILKKKFEGD